MSAACDVVLHQPLTQSVFPAKAGIQHGPEPPGSRSIVATRAARLFAAIRGRTGQLAPFRFILEPAVSAAVPVPCQSPSFEMISSCSGNVPVSCFE